MKWNNSSTLNRQSYLHTENVWIHSFSILSLINYAKNDFCLFQNSWRNSVITSKSDDYGKVYSKRFHNRIKVFREWRFPLHFNILKILKSGAGRNNETKLKNNRALFLEESITEKDYFRRMHLINDSTGCRRSNVFFNK